MSAHETAYNTENLEISTSVGQHTLLQQLKVDNQRLTEINGQLQDEVRILHKVIDILHDKKYSITEPNNPNYYRVDQPMHQLTRFTYPTGPSDPNPYNPMCPSITC